MYVLVPMIVSMILQSSRWWIFRVGIPHTMWHICCSQYAHNFVMQKGIPICKYFSDPRPYAYGDPHMRTAIPICIILNMGIQDLISHVSSCPRMYTVIFNTPICVREKLVQMLSDQIESDGKNCFLPLKLSFFYLYEYLLKEVKSEDFRSNCGKNRLFQFERKSLIGTSITKAKRSQRSQPKQILTAILSSGGDGFYRDSRKDH
jgi:hypothetical protein